MRWVGPTKWIGSTRWDDFNSTFIESSISVHSKSLSYRWTNILWSIFFFYNKQWKGIIRTNVLTLFNQHLFKNKKNSLKKTLSHLAGLVHLRSCSYGKFSSHIGAIPAKSSEIPPRRADSLFIWTHYIFIRVSKRRWNIT